MAYSIPQIAPLTYKLGQGQAPKGLPVADCTPLKKLPSVASVYVNWADYGAVTGSTVLIDLDLSSLGPSNAINEIRSVYIDNTFSDTDVFVYFPDTGFTVIAPANSTLIHPVWTNGLKCQLYASGFRNFVIPTCTFQFSNMHVNAATNISGASIIRKSIYRPSTTSDTGGNSPTRTFNAVNFGTFSPFSNQYLLIMGRGAAAAITINSITINGIAGSVRVLSDPSQAAPGVVGAIFQASQNFSGQTQQVIATCSGNVTTSICVIMTCYNLSNPSVPFNSFGPGNMPATLLTPSDGVAMAFAFRTGNGVVLTGIQNVQSLNPGADGESDGYQITNSAPLTLDSANHNRLLAMSLT